MPKTLKKTASTANFPVRLKGHIWIEGKDGTFLGYGRVALLESIREHNSISKAAKALGISYRRAWFLVDSMNRQLPHPFVETATGGRKGGGTLVTAAGERAVKEFWRVHAAFERFLAKEELQLNRSLQQERRQKIR